LKNYWNFDNNQLKTISTDENQPRLLLVSVDVTDCTHAVTFDSYRFNNNKCPLCEKPFDNPVQHLNLEHYKSDEYLPTDKVHSAVYGAEENKQVIFYKGIEIDHLISSMSTHQRFKFPEFDVWIDENTKEKHPFWDGAYLSNTPLREVLQAHKDYWKNVSLRKASDINKIEESGGKEANTGKKPYCDIPDLDIYIVNLYPAIERKFQNNLDADTIQDREIDIKFHDRTSYDVKVAEQTTAYIEIARGFRDLVDETINTLKKDGKTDQQIIESLEKKRDEILSNNTKIKGRDGKRRKRKELLDNKFAINKTTYIERLDDEYAIFGKAFDFSKKTLHELYKQGYCDAKIQYNL
jgi:NTE family protein